MTISSDFISSVSEVVRLLGSDCVFTDQTNATRNQRVAITTIGKEDASLVGSVGIEGRIVYAENMTPIPVKFDTITSPTGLIFTIHDVHEILVDNALVGLKFVVKQ